MRALELRFKCQLEPAGSYNLQKGIIEYVEAHQPAQHHPDSIA